MIGNPTGLGIIARVAQTPLAGASSTELITSLLYALKYDWIGIDDFLDRTHGHSMFDNSGTSYIAAAPGLLPEQVLAMINAGVGRFTSTPDAERYVDKYFQPTGALHMPTLTLHTTRDPLVPYFHEGLFADIVRRSGSSESLLQRSVGGFGHCAFSTDQMVDGFESLARWVETGVKPLA